VATTLVTYVDIVNEVLNYGLNDGPQVNRARIQQWVNEGQFQIARQVEGPEFQQNQTIQMISGTYIYALPAGFARVQDLSYPALSYRLAPVDIQDFDMINVANVSGPPSRYALDQGNLLLAPNPNSTDTLMLRYIGIPATLVNDTDIPALNPNYLHLLVNYALFRAFDAEDDYEAKQNFLTQYKNDLADYASDVQWRDVDRPMVVDGCWGSMGYGY
jgi:hypothetical protein